MLLKDKNVLVFAANGGVASGVADAFAAHSANLYLSSRDGHRLKSHAEKLLEDPSCGTVNTRTVDATDPDAVNSYVDEVVRETGRIDVVFNGIGVEPESGAYCLPSTEVAFDDFVEPLRVICGSQFLTARASAAAMSRTGGGSVILFTAALSGQGSPWMASITAACGAVEAMGRSLAAEYADGHVRVNTLRADGMPETDLLQRTMTLIMGQLSATGGDHQPTQAAAGDVLGRPLSVADVASTAVYLASDLSTAVSSQVVDVTGGGLRV